jgi:tRNA-splicing ligase RtcB
LFRGPIEAINDSIKAEDISEPPSVLLNQGGFTMETINIQKQDDWRWRIPRQGKMRVEGLVYADNKMMAAIQKDQSLQQVVNVATLPGIRGKSMAMPDVHWGYGFPIGGVAAFDTQSGVISPGGVGYDIN